MQRIRSFFASFRAAARGIGVSVFNERNLRFHLVAAAFVLLLRSGFELSAAEDGVLFLTIGSVIAAELLNTAVERAVDLCSPDRHPLAAWAKDAAAGAVLVLAISSVAVGIRLFWRPPVLRSMLDGLLASPLSFAALLAAVGLGVWFVFFFGESPGHSQK